MLGLPGRGRGGGPVVSGGVFTERPSVDALKGWRAGFAAFTEGPSVDALKGWRIWCFYRRTLCRFAQGVAAVLLLQKDPL